MFDVDYTRLMFGEHAVHVPAWVVVQDAGTYGGSGEGAVVSFVGASRWPQAEHPARFGSTKTHQLMVGELVFRPHMVTESDERRGSGLANLATDPFTGLVGEDKLIVDLRV